MMMMMLRMRMMMMMMMRMINKQNDRKEHPQVDHSIFLF